MECEIATIITIIITTPYIYTHTIVTLHATQREMRGVCKRGGASRLDLRTTRPSGRVNCGGSAKRIGRRQARKCGKEGKPVVQRVT
eukprot:COSAG01_NODE_55447_length_325_cov_0.570796_1_plen_85_part_01